MTNPSTLSLVMIVTLVAQSIRPLLRLCGVGPLVHIVPLTFAISSRCSGSSSGCSSTRNTWW
ncbi:hypothetical protein Hanom_Chr00s000005g01612601 [Helianthus anomalus]